MRAFCRGRIQELTEILRKCEERGIRREGVQNEFKEASRMLADASGRSRTSRNLLILKRPEKSRSARFSLGADGRRFDPGRPDHDPREGCGRDLRLRRTGERLAS